MTRKVEELKQVLEQATNESRLIELFGDVKDECNTGIAKRILAAQCGLYDFSVTYLTSHPDISLPLKVSIFECLIALMTGACLSNVEMIFVNTVP